MGKVGNPKFSIIVVAYNLEKLIGRAIDSIIEQTYTNFELLVVDDCSKDDTVKIMRQYESQDNRVKVIANERNSGPSISRNSAVDIAKGDYIVYLDGDDALYSKDTLEKINNTIGDETSDIIYFGVQYEGLGTNNKQYIPNEKNSTQKLELYVTCIFQLQVKYGEENF